MNVKPAYLGGCYYFGFYGLKRVCLHPDNPRVLVGMTVTCKDRAEDDEKTLPNMPRKHKMRLSLEQFGEVINAKSTN